MCALYHALCGGCYVGAHTRVGVAIAGEARGRWTIGGEGEAGAAVVRATVGGAGGVSTPGFGFGTVGIAIPGVEQTQAADQGTRATTGGLGVGMAFREPVDPEAMFAAWAGSAVLVDERSAGATCEPRVAFALEVGVRFLADRLELYAGPGTRVELIADCER